MLIILNLVYLIKILIIKQTHERYDREIIPTVFLIPGNCLIFLTLEKIVIFTQTLEEPLMNCTNNIMV